MAIAEIAMDGSLYDFLFKQILGLSECTAVGKYQFGCITGDFAHDFIFGLFLPHIIILIFLYIFSDWGQLRKHHAGLSTLLGIAGYVFIIYMGWYPIIAVWSIYWLALGIFLGFFNFVWSRVIHPTKSTEMLEVAKNIGGKIGESASKSKKLKILKRREGRLENLLNQATHPRVKRVYAQKLEKTRQQIEELRGH